MKKGLFIAAIASLLFASCKKNYTCTCTYTGTSQQGSISTTLHDTKSGAKATCDSYSDPDPAFKADCVIK
jgi:hypothetical protein